ncbi:DUF4160 domain-containing protein [Candidatus Dependentiae bacterium]|nr:DUF4160 domain-containing protein [Candidatus Dependentiae bacterium]
MPEISRFYGISIKMLFDDHAPPYFHVIYNEYKAIITINDFRMIKGDFKMSCLCFQTNRTNIEKTVII